MVKTTATASAMSSSSSEVESEAELIPSFPNDIALNIFARVPRSYHRTLSLVSKPIRSLLLSLRFFDARIALHSTDPIFYLTSSDTRDSWYALYRNPFNPSLFAPFRIPPIPSSSHLFDAAFAVVGPNIYVIGGTVCGSIPSSEMTSFFCYGRGGVPSSSVWVLDCRFNRWEEGPTMLAARSHAIANVVDGKIYVMGGSNSRIMAEMLDPAVGKWVELPCPFMIDKPTQIKQWIYLTDVCGERKWVEHACPSVNLDSVRGEASAVVDDKVYINTEVGEEVYHQVVFDARSGKWECVVEREDKLYLGSVLVDGVLYKYNPRGKIGGFDVKVRVWKESDYIDEGWRRAENDTLSILAYADGKFYLIWGDDTVKCHEIEVKWNGDGELLARICSTQEIVSIPRHYAKHHCLTVFL
ncbi:hypothetical protein RIF29_11502 [Crotalaria pallida]|uniref:F-box domain-containing protein n=1 Tax=Crotalaria pallida TaxID=3830 RepID=A0AAN9IM75_CROPI